MQTRFFRARKESPALRPAYRSSEIASGRFAVLAARVGRNRWRGAGSDEFRPPIFFRRQRRSSVGHELWGTPGSASCFRAFAYAAAELQMGNALDKRFRPLRGSGRGCNRNSGTMDFASRIHRRGATGQRSLERTTPWTSLKRTVRLASGHTFTVHLL